MIVLELVRYRSSHHDALISSWIVAEPIIGSLNLDVVAKRGITHTYPVRFLCTRRAKVFPIYNDLQKDRFERRGFRSISGKFRRNVNEALYRRIQQVQNPLPLE